MPTINDLDVKEFRPFPLLREDLPPPSPKTIGRLRTIMDEAGYPLVRDMGDFWANFGGSGLAWFSVTDFGAVGDGVTNDYAAFVATLAAIALAGGGDMYIPPGTYLLNSTLTLPRIDNLRIFGSKSAILKRGGTTANNVFVCTGASQIKNLVIEGFTINGNSSIVTTIGSNAEILRIGQVDGCLIRDMYIYDTPGIGIYVGAGSSVDSGRIFILNNQVKNVGCDALSDSASVEAIQCPPNGSSIYGIVIAGNQVHDETSRTDTSGGCTGISVEANSGGHAYEVAIYGNTLYNLRSNGIKLGAGVQGFAVANNTFDDVGVLSSSLSGAIICVGNEDGVIHDNTIINNLTQGISVEDCKRVNTHHNTITCTGNVNAMQLRDTSEDCIFENNSIFIASTGTSAAAILAGSGTPVQVRCKIRNNYILCTVQPAASNGLIYISSGCTDFEIERNTINNQSFTTIEAIKIGNGQTGMRIVDNVLLGTLTYTFGNQPVAFREIDKLGNSTFGKAALATTATDGFLSIPSCAGAPTGAPTLRSGQIPIVFDTTNHRLYFYENSGWHYVDRTA